MKASRIIELITQNAERQNVHPNVILFDKDTKNTYDEVIRELSNQGFHLLDVNQQVAELPDDFKISISEAGFKDESGKITIGDTLIDENEKKNLVIKAKLDRFESLIDNRTVLLITYNDLFVQDERLYETIRSWLKDGYLFDGGRLEIPVQALVALENDQGIQDFCPYGINA